MWYLGGKIRLSKYIVPIIENYIINNNMLFIDIFCGGCNIIDKINKTNNKIANDNNEYLIAMWQSLQDGWIPKDLEYTKEYYEYIKNNKNLFSKELIGLVGFHYSYGGKFFGGFARSRYSDHIERNIQHTIKQSKKLNDVLFTCKNYKEYSNIENSIIYCDPPYDKSTQKSTQYDGKFNHIEFWNWARNMSINNIILISEKIAPDDFISIWNKNHNSNMSYLSKTKTEEKLYIYNKN